MDLKNKPVIIGGKRLENLAGKLLFVAQTLIRNGFPLSTLNNTITQVMLESAWLTSNIAAKDTNLTGIKLAAAKTNVAFQKSLGVKQGSKAGYNEGNYHANYPNIDAWAKDYKRLLSAGVKPIEEIDPNAFVEKLYKNKFFTAAGYSSYKAGFVPTLNGIKSVLSPLLKSLSADKIKDSLQSERKLPLIPIIIFSVIILGILKRK